MLPPQAQERRKGRRMSEERATSEVETAGAGQAADDADTEGHSLLSYELGQTINRERQRQSEEASKKVERAVAKEHRRRSLTDRLLGR
jgi:hypothetical protein